MVFLGLATFIPPHVSSLQKELCDHSASLTRTNGEKSSGCPGKSKIQTKKFKTLSKNFMRSCVCFLTLEYSSWGKTWLYLSHCIHDPILVSLVLWELFINLSLCARNHARYQGFKDEATQLLSPRSTQHSKEIDGMREECRKQERQHARDAGRTWLRRSCLNWNFEDYGDFSDEKNQENGRRRRMLQLELQGHPAGASLVPREIQIFSYHPRKWEGLEGDGAGQTSKDQVIQCLVSCI